MAECIIPRRGVPIFESKGRVPEDENNQLIADYVPDIRYDNAVCMYDTVSKSYKTNIGTGSFIAGDPV